MPKNNSKQNLKLWITKKVKNFEHTDLEEQNIEENFVKNAND